MTIETPGDFFRDLHQESQRWADEWYERTGMPPEEWQGHQGAYIAHAKAAKRHKQTWLAVGTPAMRFGYYGWEAASKILRYGIAATLGAAVWHVIH